MKCRYITGLLLSSLLMATSFQAMDHRHILDVSPELFEKIVKGGKDAFAQLGTGAGEGIANIAPGISKFGENTAGTASQFMQKVGQTFREEMVKAMSSVGDGYANIIKPIRRELLIGAVTITGATVLIQLLNFAAQKYIQRYLFEPSLIEKKSSILSPVFSWFRKSNKISDHMVISAQLEDELNYIIATTKNIKKHGGTYENILLYGEPGTGKTLFAQLLAEMSGMKFAFVPAANINQFLAKGTAVEELNNLLAWAEKSSTGTLIFFDEIETFVGDRSTLSPEAQAALGIFLAKTGTPSSKICIIGATNRPEALDKAAKDRFGFKVEFPLPDLKARQAQLEMHIKNIFGTQKGTKVTYDYLNNNIIAVAHALEGISGRGIQQFVNRLRQRALAQDRLTVNQTMIDAVIDHIVRDQQRFQPA